jgi:hypothetical protein
MSDNEPGGIENATHNTPGGKAGYLSPSCPGCQCIAGCIFYSAGLIITREIPCILMSLCQIKTVIVMTTNFLINILWRKENRK